MPKTRTFVIAALAAASLMLASAPVSAQMAAEKPGTVLRVFFATAKPGGVADFEAGRKRHMEAHKKMGDTWTWYTYQAETGENAGSYSTVTFGHHWKDFDTWEQKNGEADDADGEKNLAPFSVGGGNAFYTFMPDISTAPVTEPTRMTLLIHFELKNGADQEFADALKKTHEAIQKTKWTESYQWYVLANGGYSPRYVLAIPLKGFADMEPSAVPFPVMLEKGIGAASAKAVMASFDKTVAREYSEIIRYRADLSYVPAK